MTIATMPANTIPRPPMPTIDAQIRSTHQGQRWQVLEDDFDKLLEEWLEEHIDGERLEVWGIPDTSVNPLADMSRQLTTPGLYGVRPTVSHASDLGMSLVGPGGFMDDAGIFTKLQQVQYYAVGMGDYLLTLRFVPEENRLSARLVSPHNVFTVCTADEPDRPVQIWELREYHHEAEEATIWAWDIYDISDRDRPSFRVVGAATAGGRFDGLDMSHIFMASEANPGGDFTGALYPWQIDGVPYMPWSQYRSADSGHAFNWRAKRGAFRGTLNSALNWSFAQHAARDASGTTTFAIGVEAPATTTRNGVQGFKATPGSIHFLKRDADSEAQPMFHESGPGANLDKVAAYATLYEQKQAVRWGLNPSDVTRTNNTPTSGAALFVSNQGRRDFAKRVEPMFRASDIRTIQICAALLTAGGVGAFPLDGYSIEYAPIPKSAGEEKEERERLDWEESKGALTRTQVVMSRRPGISRDQAFALIVASQVEAAELERAVAEELARRGFAPEPEPDTDNALEE